MSAAASALGGKCAALNAQLQRRAGNPSNQNLLPKLEKECKVKTKQRQKKRYTSKHKVTKQKTNNQAGYFRNAVLV